MRIPDPHEDDLPPLPEDASEELRKRYRAAYFLLAGYNIYAAPYLQKNRRPPTHEVYATTVLGMTGNRLSQYLNAKRTPAGAIVNQIAEAIGPIPIRDEHNQPVLDADGKPVIKDFWQVMGVEMTMPKGEEPRLLVTLYRRMKKGQRKQLLEVAKELAEEADKESQGNQSNQMQQAPA